MTDLRTAAQQALEALESGVSLKLGWMPDCEDAITALKAALADGDNLSPGEPVQEPVGYANERDLEQMRRHGGGALLWGRDQLDDLSGYTPLYTSPPQRKPLTEEEIKKLLIESAGMTVVFSEVDLRFARAIERAHGIT